MVDIYRGLQPRGVGLPRQRFHLSSAEARQGSATWLGEWTYSTTAGEVPSSGQFRLDTPELNQMGATLLRINYLAAPGEDYRNLLAFWEGGRVLLQDKDDGSKYQVYEIVGTGTDKGSYYEFAVIWRNGGTALPAGQRVLIGRAQ